MKLEELKEILEEFQKTKWKKVRLKDGDFELDLELEGSPSAPAQTSAPSQVVQPAAEESKAPTQGKKEYITSPMVGTFYATPSPDQAPFVKVGDKVEEKSVVCIIEAMKVMNEVKAGKKGTIVEILVDNAQPVEYGTKLFRIE